MKKTLLIFCLLSVYFYVAQAQITLDFNDLAVPVKTFDFRKDTAVDPSITPGNPGPGQTWNFMALHSTLDTMTIDVVNSNTINTGGMFAGSNIATIYDSALIMYFFNSSPLGLVLHGTIYDFFKTGDSIMVELSTPDTVLTLPGAYGDSATRNSFGDTKSHCNIVYDTMGYQIPVDSLRIKHAQIKTSVNDAWGTMTLPGSPNFDVIRQKDYATSQDSIWGHTTFPGLAGWHFLYIRYDTVLTYTWWPKNLGIHAVKFVMGSPTAVMNAEFVYDIDNSISENELSLSNVFPNPASDYINISNTAKYKEVVLFDVLGNEISRHIIGNKDQVRISVKELPNGLYFYNAINGATKSSGKFVVKH
ncbi:MAG TPA: T9SS type A sorting domain-containing protein [Bacteroidales bacterium]|nr:T9SS type A sorting domain-containing protein [Bacteroidales bacterium]HQI71389.1 T9SS type A sorting domain-containing protein [Bacteroidales bacterium]